MDKREPKDELAAMIGRLDLAYTEREINAWFDTVNPGIDWEQPRVKVKNGEYIRVWDLISKMVPRPAKVEL